MARISCMTSRPRELRQIDTGKPVVDGGNRPTESTLIVSSADTEISGTLVPVEERAPVSWVLVCGTVGLGRVCASQSMADNGICSADKAVEKHKKIVKSLTFIQLDNLRCGGLIWRKIRTKKRTKIGVANQGHKA